MNILKNLFKPKQPDIRKYIYKLVPQSCTNVQELQNQISELAAHNLVLLDICGRLGWWTKSEPWFSEVVKDCILIHNDPKYISHNVAKRLYYAESVCRTLYNYKWDRDYTLTTDNFKNWLKLNPHIVRMKEYEERLELPFKLG